ncbi:MAG: 30S ribosomal protein S20 [Candidatus Marinimicrobia bacterium]|jgi:small subunit ribosomal protein S20|uniref:30S ribosomal protein S20 n=1 Tax=marine metagenome TaxID=408172 RepID=A0A381YPN8_9ZZZZ|nr:30S ribosomal protein S20 [Candidatus Neomarinimicrobiota bacterium]MAZ65322.1 30S ribosomal protein S20 [Candidatus Neomarinimicrobiota bacterium]MCH2650745.1 30S ribosomal protein S20 [Candidatus Neomarinimicrobiota bacterium]MCS5646218.1 30S ribosomal protein S20 [Candidatus Neomarinimicrobiota bacterium]MEC7736124.1 30S ribosomal protein S20 [Candidatus Neomarinimicrobiota bacterium]|tara:strand:- start:2926 stop:3180 length:255 start_codon:yes stop_codon:yes gene_type:complete
MDRHPQQIKRERQDKKRRARNVDGLSRLRTHVKKVLSATTKSDAELVYGNAVRVIDKAVNKNLIHKNTGARRKAQITRHLNSLS